MKKRREENLGIMGERAARVEWMLLLAVIVSGILYSGDMGGDWAHGVGGGITAVNAIVAGAVLLAVSRIRRRMTTYGSSAAWLFAQVRHFVSLRHEARFFRTTDQLRSRCVS